MKFALMCLLLACMGGPARAAPVAPAAAAQAKAAYERGVGLFKAKQFREAVAEFNAAYRLDPSPILLYNIARAFEQLREYGSAREFYKQYLTQPNITDRAAVEQTVRTLELLEKEQGAGIAQTRYEIASDPPGAEVLLDGKPVGTAPMTLTNNRGTYTIELRKPGFETQKFERAFAMNEQSETITLSPAKAVVGAVVPPDVAPATGVSERAGPSSRAVWGWTTVGVGAAMLGGAVLTGLQAQSYADKLDEIDANPGAFDDQDFDDAQSSGRTWGITTDVLLGLGAASIGTGIWLLLTDDAAGESAAWVPYNAGVAYQGRF